MGASIDLPLDVCVSPLQCDTAVHQKATINAILVQKVSNDILLLALTICCWPCHFFLYSKQLQATNTSVIPPWASIAFSKPMQISKKEI